MRTNVQRLHLRSVRCVFLLATQESSFLRDENINNEALIAGLSVDSRNE